LAPFSLPLAWVDHDTACLIAVNQAYAEARGYRPQEMAGMNLSRILGAPWDEQLDAIRADLEKDGRLVFETTNIRKNGTTFPVLVDTTLIRDASGQPHSRFTYALDLTNLKRVESDYQKSVALFRTLINGIPDLVWLRDRNGIFRLANSRMEQCLGVAMEEILGKSLHHSIEPALAAVCHQSDRKVITSGKPHLYEQKITFACDGHQETLEIIKVPYVGEDGQMAGVFGVGRDVTIRKRIENDLLRSHANLTAILESTDDLIWSVDTDCALVVFNSNFASHIKNTYGMEAKVGERLVDLLPAERAAMLRHHLNQAMTGGPFRHECPLPGGKTLELALNPVVVDGRTVGVSVFGKDITERKRGEAITRARLRLLEFAGSHTLEELLTATLDEIETLTGSTIGFYHLVEPDQRTLHLQARSTNTMKNLCTAEGKGTHDNIDLPGVWVDCIHQRSPVIHNDYLSLQRLKGVPGGYLPLTRAALTPIFHGDQVKAVIGVGNKEADYQKSDLEVLSRLGDLSWDIAERKRAEEAVAAHEREYRALVEKSPDNIIRYDRDCRVRFVNTRFKSTVIPEQDPALGKTPLEVAAQEGFQGDVADYKHYQAILTQVIARGESADVEMHMPDGAGGTRIHSIRLAPECDAEGRIVGALGFGRDITEQRRLEEQLRQSQRMESIGRLAGGVAHDFNNMLAVILMNTEMGLQHAKDHPKAEKVFGMIRNAALHSADLTKQLLAFARQQPISPKIIDLNEGIETALKMMRRLIGEEIEIVWRPGSAVWKVWLDPTQLDQLLVNLLVNARDAISGKGTISIRTENLVLAEGGGAGKAKAAPGEYVAISVSDDGCGMSPEMQARIFEPFFTTKGMGKGTGLGLATTYGVVRQNKGYIHIESEAGKGTTFRILFPRCQALAPGNEAKESPRPAGAQSGETLLVVEDCVAFLETIKSLLETLGYQVISTSRPEEAISLIEANRHAISLVLSDVTMPGVDGFALAKQVQAKFPNLKLLLMSGYPADGISKRGVIRQDLELIQKPFTLFELAKKLRAVLTAPQGSAPELDSRRP
jgi:PAS domain S-box-containing protein